LEEKEFNDILGYGKKMKIFVSKNGDGKEVEESSIELHFTPVSLKELPTLQKKLEEWSDASGKGAFNKQAITVAAEIIRMSLKKMHSDYTTEMILETFTYGGLAKAITIVVDLNDFLSDMGELSKLVSQMKT